MFQKLKNSILIKLIGAREFLTKEGSHMKPNISSHEKGLLEVMSPC